MATKPYTAVSSPYEVTNVSLAQVTLNNGDDSAPFICAERLHRSVTISGTFGAGGNVILEGQNLPGSVTWFTLRDYQGLSLATITAARIVAILEPCYAIRARVSAGDGTTALVVTFLGTRT
jgi:hypothetical protein